MVTVEDRIRLADPARRVAAYDEATTRSILQLAYAARRGVIDLPDCPGAVAQPGEAGEAPRVMGLRPRPIRSARRLALAAVAATAVVVAAPILWPVGSAGGATPAAATVLERAAIGAVDPPARGDQYYRVTSRGSTLAISDTGTWLMATSRVRYVAVDGSRPDYVVELPQRVIRQIRGIPGELPSSEPDLGGTWTTDLPPDAIPGSWQSPNLRWLAALPRDESALRERVYADADGHGRSTDGEVLVLVADVLRSGLVPADLRRALFRVLRTVPGVDVTSATATVDGRLGVGLGRTETRDGTRQELVFDASTGEVIGERQVDLAGTIVPAGSTMGDTAVTRVVVDEIPAAVRSAAEHQVCAVESNGAVTCHAGGAPAPR